MKNGDKPAFLPVEHNDTKDQYFGLTKREAFAMEAIPPETLLREILTKAQPGGFVINDYIAMVVGYKKAEADALLAALEES